MQLILLLRRLPLPLRWVCKMVKKKFKSTVLCCAFHPFNGQLLATGSADFKCRVFSTFATDVDGTAVNPGPFSAGVGPLEFGEAYTELSALGWVHAVAWSPSGDVLAYTGHDSSVHFADLTTIRADVEPVVRTVRLSQLPLCSLLFVAEYALVGAGHDFNPALLTCSTNGDQEGTWSFFGYIDKEEAKDASAAAATSGVSAARELFKNKTARGTYYYLLLLYAFIHSYDCSSQKGCSPSLSLPPASRLLHPSSMLAYRLNVFRSRH